MATIKSDYSETELETRDEKHSITLEKENKENAMESVLSNSYSPPKPGEIVEGPVVAVDKSSVFIDLTPYGTGIIYGREFINARDILKNVKVGDEISAKVIDAENEEGYIELSLKEARQAIIWSEALEGQKESVVYELTVKDANKGGLLLDWQGVRGFLPASQLKPEHYPRVEGGDKEKILKELKDLVGETLSVSIITADPKEEKLIFSEKSPAKKDPEEIVEKYQEGEVVEGTITGIVEFGIFVKIEEGLEGLAHISELDWGLVEDPGDLFNVGQHVKAKIIEIKDEKISLSIKALKENPWVEAAKRYEKGQEVEGVIIKFNDHGALASIEEGVAGLVHVSEFGTQETLREILELGKTYPFEISLFKPRERRMALTYLGDDKPEIEPDEEETEGKEDQESDENTEEEKEE